MTFAKSFHARREQHEAKRINQADTAIENFHAVVLPYATEPQQQLILEVMRRMQKYKPDFTIGEIAHNTKLQKSTVSARRYAMLKAGLLERGYRRQCTISGIHCETVRLPQDMSV